MNRLNIGALSAVLPWIGRQGTKAVAALVVIGLAVPAVGNFFKPFVTEAVFVLLCLAFLRVEGSGLKTYLLRPALLLLATAWSALALGFMASQRNLRLMLAATGGMLPDLVWVYFALSQFPIYLSPQLLDPLTRRVLNCSNVENGPSAGQKKIQR